MNTTAEAGRSILAQPNVLLAGATLLGALVGVVGSYIARHIIEKQNRNREKRQIRLALRSEMNSMSTLKNWRDYFSAGDAPVQEIEADTVYRSLVKEVGLLTEDELTASVEFYSKLSEVNRMATWNHELTRHVLLDPRAELDEQDRRKRGQKVINKVKQAEQARADAVRKIESNLALDDERATNPQNRDDKGGQ